MVPLMMRIYEINAYFYILKNKNRGEQVKKAKAVVQQWKQMCEDSLKNIGIDEQSEETNEYNERWKELDDSILEVMHQVNNHAASSLESLRCFYG
jgi:hypothetical protein